MADFPITRNVSLKYYSSTSYKKQIKSKFESGVQSSRAVHTRARKKVFIGWDALPLSEYQLIVQFFEENQGGIFTFTDLVIGEPRSFRFTNDELPRVTVTGWMYNKSGELEQAMDTGAIEIEEI